MLSRVAERIYWAGRYLERAENTARLVNTYANLLLDLPEETGVTWSQLLKIVALDDLYAERHRKAKEEKVLRFLLVDERNPGSILSSLREARENVRTTRDVVPTEVWESVNEFYLMGQHQLARAV
ncbi:MAG: alpha-E domain-containing protein, partial [Myxococcota bacterium]